MRISKKAVCVITIVGLILLPKISVALPPPSDIPEEILRGKIITEGRSPLNNQAISAAQYSQIKERLQESGFPPQLDSKTRSLIWQLQLLKLFRDLIPF